MDLILAFWDRHLFTPYIWPDSWPENNLLRQACSMSVIITFGVYALYLLSASLNYVLIFDKRVMMHQLFIEHQVRKELCYSLKVLPLFTIPTIGCFLLELRGYSQLYDFSERPDKAWWNILFEIIGFTFFIDTTFYWIHRSEHHRYFYKYIHKQHHTWKVPTPFSSHSLHPVDGFLQAVPFHIYVMLFPTHKLVFLTVSVFLNFWAISLHDGDFRMPFILRPLIYGSAHHTDHHVLNNCNYGLLFTLWDHIGGTYRIPLAFEGKAPLDDVLRMQLQQQKSAKKLD